MLALCVVAACTRGPARGVDVVASFYPLGYLATRIGSPDVTVETLIPSGVEPHDYEPTTSDLIRLSDAKLLIVQGVGFEGWLESARRQADVTRVAVATEGIELRAADSTCGVAKAGTRDPHTWLDPVLFAKMARNVERALASAFPEHAAGFARRTDALEEHLAALDREFRDGLARCSTPFVITSHAAFGYLACEYGFTQLGIEGLSPNAEPDPRTVSRVVDEARAHGVTVVFFEDLVTPRVAEVVAKEIGAQVRVLSPLEGIAPEAARHGADYASVMRENLAALRDAMHCS